MTNDIEYFFMFIDPSYMFLGKVSILGRFLTKTYREVLRSP